MLGAEKEREVPVMSGGNETSEKSLVLGNYPQVNEVKEEIQKGGSWKKVSLRRRHDESLTIRRCNEFYDDST
nr:hypothetical protein CFP56_56052 [Quercus suber]